MLDQGGDTRMFWKEPLSGVISLTGLLHQTDGGKDGVTMSNLQKIEEKGKPCCLDVSLSKPEN